MSVLSESRISGRIASRSRPVLRPPKCFLITLENDSPFRLWRDKASYASRSIVIVLTAMHLSCTYLRPPSRLIERNALSRLAEFLQAAEVVAPVEVEAAVDLVGELAGVVLEEGDERDPVSVLHRKDEAVVLPVLLAGHALPLDAAARVEPGDLHDGMEDVAEAEIDPAPDPDVGFEVPGPPAAKP